MDLVEAVHLLAVDLETTARGAAAACQMVNHEWVDHQVVTREITDALIALAFHTVLDATDAELEEAVEEIACEVRAG